ncbi:MAG: GyrI-like domain-containing protein [Dehalococcoidales bacterium]|nr:GyrI-like domain-containing protein [Dehalococcoidales bacterium]
MDKLDLKKTYKQIYYLSATSVSIVDVPVFNYIMVNGQGAPDGAEAQQAIEMLFPLAYAIKFISKGRGKDYGVMPLEGLWWADDMNDFVANRRDKWKWTYMIMQPEFISQNDFEEAIEKVQSKNRMMNLSSVHFNSLAEGKAAQIMHIGPFSEEHTNIRKIHEHIASLGGKFDGSKEKHHEIYLSDMRKVSPSAMKTILRQPFHLI